VVEKEGERVEEKWEEFEVLMEKQALQMQSGMAAAASNRRSKR
jgi:hypothetical protein